MQPKQKITIPSQNAPPEVTCTLADQNPPQTRLGQPKYPIATFAGHDKINAKVRNRKKRKEIKNRTLNKHATSATNKKQYLPVRILTSHYKTHQQFCVTI